MEPGTVFTALELSFSVLRLGYRVHNEFFGKDRSIDKLRQLNGRLQALTAFLQRIAKDAKDSGLYLTEPFEDTHTRNLEITLEECKEFLNKYERALSESGRGSKFQRAKYIVSQDESRLRDFHERIDRHYDELHQWSSLSIHHELRNIRNHYMSPPMITGYLTQAPALMNRSPEQGPVRGLTGDTLIESSNDALLRATCSHSPNSNPISRTPSLASIPELPPSIVSRPSDNHPSVNTRERAITPGNILLSPSSDSTEVNLITAASLGRLSYTSTIPEGNEQLSRPRASCHISQGLSTITGITQVAAVSATQGHRIVVILGRSMWTFDLASYAVYDKDNTRIVEWNNQTTKIIHYLPESTRRIPHTKPNDPKFEISFLPMSAKHVFEIIEHDNYASIHERPRYQFSHKPDREAFQQKLRNRASLQMVQAKEIQSKHGIIAQDVHLKVWSRGERDEVPTFSFAHHGVGENNHQEEYVIRWFRKTPRLEEPAKLILSVYTQEGDLHYGRLPEESRRRSSSFGIGNITRRLSGGSPKPLTVNSNTVPLYDASTKGIDPPQAVQQLGQLEIEFASPRLRDNFLTACYEVHHGPMSSLSSRKSTAISDGLPSPELCSRPPSLHIPPERLSRSDTSSDRHQSPAFNTPQYTQNPNISNYTLPQLRTESPGLTEEVHLGEDGYEALSRRVSGPPEY